MHNLTEPVTLKPESIQGLLKEMSRAKHDVNNSLALISATAELLRMNPDLLPKLIGTLGDQPQRISDSLQALSAQIEQSVGLRKG